jgi:hypothetical protein
MIALLCFFLTLLVSPFKSKSRLETENVALRRQLIILRRKVHGRVQRLRRDFPRLDSSRDQVGEGPLNDEFLGNGSSNRCTRATPGSDLSQLESLFAPTR